MARMEAQRLKWFGIYILFLELDTNRSAKLLDIESAALVRLPFFFWEFHKFIQPNIINHIKIRYISDSIIATEGSALKDYWDTMNHGYRILIIHHSSCQL